MLRCPIAEDVARSAPQHTEAGSIGIGVVQPCIQNPNPNNRHACSGSDCSGLAAHARHACSYILAHASSTGLCVCEQGQVHGQERTLPHYVQLWLSLLDLLYSRKVQAQLLRTGMKHAQCELRALNRVTPRTLEGPTRSAERDCCPPLHASVIRGRR